MNRPKRCLKRTSNAIDSAFSSFSGGKLGGVNEIQRLAVEAKMCRTLKNTCMVKRPCLWNIGMVIRNGYRENPQ